MPEGKCGHIRQPTSVKVLHIVSFILHSITYSEVVDILMTKHKQKQFQFEPKVCACMYVLMHVCNAVGRGFTY